MDLNLAICLADAPSAGRDTCSEHCYLRVVSAENIECNTMLGLGPDVKGVHVHVTNGVGLGRQADNIINRSSPG